jgi:hypothetical protein
MCQIAFTRFVSIRQGGLSTDRQFHFPKLATTCGYGVITVIFVRKTKTTGSPIAATDRSLRQRRINVLAEAVSETQKQNARRIPVVVETKARISLTSGYYWKNISLTVLRNGCACRVEKLEHFCL